MEKPFLDFYYSVAKIWDKAQTTDGLYTIATTLTNELHKKIINIFQTGRSYYMIFNFRDVELEFISAEIQNVLGYKPCEMTATLFLQSIHPDDKNYFLKFENRVTQFYKELPPEKRGNYIYHHDYRVKNKNDKYIRILHQIVPIEYDEHNFYKTLAMHTDITHIKRDGVPALSIIGLHDEPSYYDIQDTENFTKSYSLFTNREKEIITLIIEGCGSKEIAQELRISLYTVNNHRKNILKKAKVKTPQDLLKKAINEGWNYNK